MKITCVKLLGLVAVAGVVALTGCEKKTETAGVGERTGAALDEAAEKTADAAKSTAATVKDATGRAVEKTGEVMEKAGNAVEKAGSNMQK